MSDLLKAFDTLEHTILLQKLKHYGIDGKALQLCEIYLTNRTQYVEINGVKSGALPITTGVPQGSILGPLLFIIYINDFSFASTAFTFISYADDTTHFSTVSNFTNTPNTDTNCLINQKLFKINEWLEINKLSLNLAKTKYKNMLFHMHNKNVSRGAYTYSQNYQYVPLAHGQVITVLFNLFVTFVHPTMYI